MRVEFVTRNISKSTTGATSDTGDSTITLSTISVDTGDTRGLSGENRLVIVDISEDTTAASISGDSTGITDTTSDWTEQYENSLSEILPNHSKGSTTGPPATMGTTGSRPSATVRHPVSEQNPVWRNAVVAAVSTGDDLWPEESVHTTVRIPR